MNHQGTKTIETPRLILRAFALSDAAAMFTNWAHDPEVTKYLMWQPHENVAATTEILSSWVKMYERLDFYQWAITLKGGGDAPVGSIAAVQVNDRLELVHIGYCIGRHWWRQGITSEAMSGIIKFFFEDVRVNRVESRHDPSNPNSGKVMLKCGMVYEGTHRQADWNNQGLCDCAHYAILASEYFGQKKA